VHPFYSGLFLPAQTPRDVVARLHDEAAKGMQTPAVQERFKQLGVEPMPMTPEQFGTFFRDDVGAAVKIVKAANIPQQ
jgi:tripartite-type tricarboxylate transporter receptor subunit TctC